MSLCPSRMFWRVLKNRVHDFGSDFTYLTSNDTTWLKFAIQLALFMISNLLSKENEYAKLKDTLGHLIIVLQMWKQFSSREDVEVLTCSPCRLT